MTDWAAIKAEWCAGDLSNVKIAAKYGVTEGALRKYAKANEWERGNPAKPNLAPIEKSTPPPKVVDTDSAQEISANALSIAARMVAELDATTSLLAEIEGWIEEDTKDDNSPTRRNAMLKAISLPTRALTLKTIQQAITEMQKVGKPDGKKAQRQQAAEKVHERFKPGKPPLALVPNKVG